ncbi:MAG: GH3 auxin-responsive promoter family protein [Flavobacteriales bacterium]
MGLKALLSKPFAKAVSNNIKKWAAKPAETQQKVLEDLIAGASHTAFGKDHRLSEVKTYADFKNRVPVKDYEGLKTYIERAKNGEADVLWKGKPIYFCKTSGTTSGTKYIPITKESMPNHIHSARNALLCYIAETGNSEFVDGKMIFLQGSPELDEANGIPFGRLSGIVAHHVPAYLQKNRMPSYVTNCIDDWETKVNAIVDETIKEDMRLISGIPSWVQMYFERLQQKSGGKPIKDIFPKFSLFVYGGVNYEPYRSRFEQLIGKRVDSIELYPASEGFIAFQDSQKEKGMLLVLNKGIFYEFIPADRYFDENPPRLSISEVELGVNYALILNTNAGLFGYSIGDTIKFVSKKPYRIIVSGRIKHFTSAFGEHVIAEEVEEALQAGLRASTAEITEFTVAPQVSPQPDELPYHEWFIEFTKNPDDMEAFRLTIDLALQEKNVYYKDLITGSVLQPLKITPIAKDGFNKYMKNIGKLGGQNKVPRLSNDRNIADELNKFKA